MNRLKWIPNCLTITRIILCPVIIGLVVSGRDFPALYLFLASCLTDVLDGYTARKLNATTEVGRFLDPLADRLTSLSFFALLMSLGECPAWFLGLIISVSLLQFLGVIVLKATAAEPYVLSDRFHVGKGSSILQFIWIALLLADRHSEHLQLSSMTYYFGYSLLGTTQVAVFFRYFFHFQQQIRETSPLSAQTVFQNPA